MRAAAVLLAALVALPCAGAGADPLPACATAPGVNDRCEQWQRRFSDNVRSGSHTDTAAGMVRNARGDRLYVATTTSVDGATHQTVAALSATSGATIWLAHAPGTLPTTAAAVALSPDQSTVVVAGTLVRRENLNASPRALFYTAAYDAATGRPRWQATYLLGGESNAVVAVRFSPTGSRVFVVGSSSYAGVVTYIEWMTLAYAPRTGALLWKDRYGGAAGGQNVPAGVAVSPSGDTVYVTGKSEHPTTSPTQTWDYATIAYRARDGHRRWRWVGRYGAQNLPVAIAATGSRVVVTGTVGADTVTIALAATTGRSLWRATYRNPSGDTAPTALAVSPHADRVYLAARGGATAATVGYDMATGREAWARSYAPPADYVAVPGAVTVAASGTVYVGAAVAPPPGLVGYLATLAYDARGTLSWVARYDARDPGAVGYVAPVAVVAAPSARAVYVAAAEQRLAGMATGLLCAHGVAATGCADNPSAALVVGYAA